MADAFLDSAKTFLVCSIIGFTIGEYVKLGGGVIFAFDSSGSSLARVELWGLVCSFSELVFSCKFVGGVILKFESSGCSLTRVELLRLVWSFSELVSSCKELLARRRKI